MLVIITKFESNNCSYCYLKISFIVKLSSTLNRWNFRKNQPEFDTWEFYFLLKSHYFDIWVKIMHYYVRKGLLYLANLEQGFVF